LTLAQNSLKWYQEQKQSKGGLLITDI